MTTPAHTKEHQQGRLSPVANQRNALEGLVFFHRPFDLGCQAVTAHINALIGLQQHRASLTVALAAVWLPIVAANESRYTTTLP